MPTKTNPVLMILKDDHKKVKGLFEEYQGANPRKQQEITDTVIHELEVHATLEEALIYPAIREQIDEEDLMKEATEEHHLVHVLVAELKKLDRTEETFKAKFTVLGELVKHHVKEEEGEMFPKAQKAEIDWEILSAEVEERKEQLTAKLTARA
jgi:hemerythrin superfamily protein